MAVFKITESSVSLVKNESESKYSGSFASLILECQENDMRIFNAILESDYEEAVRITEGVVLEGEKAQKAWKTVKDVAAIIAEGIKKFGKKLKQLFDAAVAKIKEIHTKKIAKFAEDFEKEFDASKYDENKILSKDIENIPIIYTSDLKSEIVSDIDINSLIKSNKSDIANISNRVANPDYAKELVSNAFNSSKSTAVAEMKDHYKNEKFITPSMFSKFISDRAKNRYKYDKSYEDYSKGYYANARIADTVKKLCERLKSSNTVVKDINEVRKNSFKQLNDLMKNAKESEKSIDDVRACLEYSSAYQTVIATIANVNIKIVMIALKNNIKALNAIKSACSKGDKKEDKSKGEEAAAATNEAFSMLL